MEAEGFNFSFIRVSGIECTKTRPVKRIGGLIPSNVVCCFRVKLTNVPQAG